MMHHKAILALKAGAEETPEQEDEVLGWAYMGSHNLTQAAWGNISQTKGSTEPQVRALSVSRERNRADA